MAVKNGGIIGPANTHTGGRFGVAKGVWRLADALNFTKEGTWPTAAINGTNTVRFNDGSSDFLSRTAPTPIGSRRVFTVSCWVKRTDLGSTDQDFYSNYYSTDNMIEIRFTSVDTLRVHNRGGASSTIDLRTSRKFKSPLPKTFPCLSIVVQPKSKTSPLCALVSVSITIKAFLRNMVKSPLLLQL